MSIGATTLSVALAAGDTVVTPASMTGITDPGKNKSNRKILWAGREAMEVLSIDSTAGTATVVRGVLGTIAAAHYANALLFHGAEADYSAFMQEWNGDGVGTYAKMSLPFFTTVPTTAIDTATLTVDQLLGGLLTGTPTAAANYTTPTATDLIAALENTGASFIGKSFEFVIKNTSLGANTITLVAGTGVTLVGTGTVAQNQMRRFLVRVTDPVAKTLTIYSLDTSAF